MRHFFFLVRKLREAKGKEKNKNTTKKKLKFDNFVRGEVFHS